MLYLFNTTIMPNEGIFVNEKISLERATQILEIRRIPLGYPGEGQFNFTSALGHQGSVDAFNELFPGLDCQLNRIQATMEVGDSALCLKVLGRLPEGEILDKQKLEEIGFEFYHVYLLAKDINDLESQAQYCGAAPITGRIWNI